MAMDTFLAEYYGTAQPAQDESEKTAQVELFAKLAAAEGIDLNSLSDAQVEHLYNSTFSKEASEDEDEDEKKEKAKEEHQEKKAAAEKFAEADYMGRVMAHAYVQEMRKIAESSEEDDGDDDGEKEAGVREVYEAGKGHAGRAGKAIVRGAKAVGGAFMGKNIKSNYKGMRRAGKNVDDLKATANQIGHTRGAAGVKAREGLHRAIDEGSPGTRLRNARKALAKRVGATGAAYSTLGATAVGAHHMATKEGSALEELAGDLAVEKAAEAGWNADEAADRITALITLGASEEGSKVASAVNVDHAIDIRSSELLELAGYPVDWS